MGGKPKKYSLKNYCGLGRVARYNEIFPKDFGHKFSVFDSKLICSYSQDIRYWQEVSREQYSTYKYTAKSNILEVRADYFESKTEKCTINLQHHLHARILIR